LHVFYGMSKVGCNLRYQDHEHLCTNVICCRTSRRRASAWDV
jgi:hypothetical protein